MLWKKILCPYCLEKVNSKDVKTVCNICGKEIQLSAKDIILNKPPRCNVTPGCRGIGSGKKCGFCDRNLPSDIMDYSKYLRFSILGIPGAGKSIFLTAMMHELVKNQANFPWIFQTMENYTQTVFRQNEKLMMVDGYILDPTPPGVAPLPQLWRIRDKHRMTDHTIPAYSMVVFDGAGEDSEHINDAISRYIDGSKTLIILVDPLALPGVASLVPPEVLKYSTNTKHNMGASTDMVNGLADYIRKNCGLDPGRLINKDVAIVFTKFDTVRASFGQSVVTKPSPHLAARGFVKADADAVDAEIRDWLSRHGESTFIDAVETNFVNDKVRFFGVSSLGQPPKSEKRLAKVMPHRVTDPMVWMLSREGIVPVIE